jgi:hypothetical protein
VQGARTFRSHDFVIHDSVPFVAAFGCGCTALWDSLFACFAFFRCARKV